MKADFAEKSIEEVKEFWNRRPCNLKHSAAPLGSKRYFDEVEKKKFFVEPHIPAFADFPSAKGLKVLDLGCGLGTMSLNFARAGAAKVVCVDLSEASLELAKKRAEVYGLSDRMEFYCANAEELSRTVPVESFDLIFSFGVLHHTPHPEKALRELSRYLRPGGKLKIMVYYRYAWKAFEILLKYGRLQFWKLPELVARYSEAQTGCPVTYTYSRFDAVRLLASCGFKATRCEVDHIFPYQIEAYREHRYEKVWYFRWMPMRLFRFLERTLGWHLCITAEKS